MVNPRVIEYLATAALASAQPLIHYQVDVGDAGPVLAKWNAAVLGTQPTPQQIATAEASQGFADWLATHGDNASQTLRRVAKEGLDALEANRQLDRAIAAVAMDEINILRQWLTDFKTQVAAATNLADLKIRVANISGNLSQRTLDQVRTAVKNKIDAGTVDA